jgi:hypothetical protein
MIKAKSPQFWQYYAVIGALAILNVLASSTVFFFTSANQLNDFIPPLRLSLGLNLAALTLLGPTLVPGVWLGEFLFTRGLHLPLLTCLAIACGMALQAWLGCQITEMASDAADASATARCRELGAARGAAFNASEYPDGGSGLV